MYILGISSYYHDSAACILKDGKIVAAAQEERFTRIKHDARFPSHAIDYCLKEANIAPTSINNVVFYEKPFLKFERLIETYLAYAPKGFRSFIHAMPLWIKDKLFQKYTLTKELESLLGSEVNWQDRILFSEHHLSHAASAYFPSPYKNAAILTLDGVGEWTTASLAVGDGSDIKILKEVFFPHSLGLLYSAFTYYTGFKVNSGEYKLMGLAPYGVPKYSDLIKEKLVTIFEDGTFQLDMSYFNYPVGLTMTNSKFNSLFGGPPREPESEITQLHMDLAASIQKVTEEIILKLAKGIANSTGEENLCLAGGVALNCVANGVLHRSNIFKNIWVQPAAGDAGGALGAALAVWHMHFNNKRDTPLKDNMEGAYLGPQYSDDEIEKDLISYGVTYKKFTKEELVEFVAESLSDGKAVGWMQGRMEFGPRALGNRSIIADARSPSMQKQLNLKVKYRESFRPFAPSIIREDLEEWFEHNADSPYMLMVANVKKDKCFPELKNNDLFGIEKLNLARSEVPAITHVDYSARIQTVHKESNPLYHSLISSFKTKTGCPILVNTSFNVRGEPIICSPADALKCFFGTELDVLAIGSFVLLKDQQKIELLNEYKENYDLD